MIKVPYGQDAYSVIGKYIRDHITAIEDIIAVIKIDDIITNQLFMVDMNEENYFIWNNDWYEGEKDVTLIDFFPVSEAINPSAQPQRKTGKWIHGREMAREIIWDCTTAIFYEGWTCSECGCLVEKEREPWYKYCPNCGADMRGEDDDIPIEYFESGGK